MAFSTQYAQQYQQAVSAYMQGHYTDAAALADSLITEAPDDPNLQLLCGHIYSCLKQYDTAQQHYQQVLHFTQDPELLNCAQSSLSDIAQVLDEEYPSSGNSRSSGHLDPELFDEVEDQTQLQMGALSQASPTSKIAGAALASSYIDSETAYSQAPAPQTAMHNHAHELGIAPAADLSSDSDLFLDDDEDITLLMGKKNSQMSENTAMPANQSPDDLARQQLDSSYLETDSDDVLDIPDQHPADGAMNDNVNAPSFDGGEFSDFLNNLEDHADLSDFDDDSPLNTVADFGLDTNLMPGVVEDPAEVEEGATPDQDNAFSPSAAEEGGAVAGYGAVAQSMSLSQKSEKAAALNVSSRRMPLLAPFENAPLQKKQLIMAASTGITTGAAVMLMGSIAKAPASAWAPSALAGGLVGGLTTLALGQVLTRQIKASTSDLQAKLGAVAQGDWTVKAIELSSDEFGHLAKSFNQMTQFIESTTSEAQRKAGEQEKAKEDLQRQVIRLLDDVEGAARGDLTVQAEVTADILGAVADSFNLTIYNLQKIVKQVKVAAREVNRGAAENEEFARGLSSDALRQAEELAATLNSVQMMTTSIQEVAESARAADQVAHRASEAALRGGKSVESTVAGILQIRETVAETTRKVKRLAESSQEISKIVGLISQIASRTNLLALNASIEAARAGESGRGFAVVADEVRQLADRAAKASKEIEQIVLQIQGETGSVMTAMEEGTQQVIEGTQRAEQAKESLEDIIQVSEQITQLVSSITRATAEQTETSRYVAQVMQNVELTAQETSQESQRVSDSLRNLVGVARDLQSSVERFKVEGTEFS